jgi:hypothetical protein
MIDKPELLPLLLSLAALTACATGEPVNREREPTIDEIRQMLGCADDEIAVCIAIDCDPDDYHCAEKESVEDMLGPEGLRLRGLATPDPGSTPVPGPDRKPLFSIRYFCTASRAV